MPECEGFQGSEDFKLYHFKNLYTLVLHCTYSVRQMGSVQKHTMLMHGGTYDEEKKNRDKILSQTCVSMDIIYILYVIVEVN